MTTVRAAIQAAAEKARRDEILRKAKDLESAAQRIIDDLMGVDMPFTEDDFKEVMRLRDNLSASMLNAGISYKT